MVEDLSAQEDPPADPTETHITVGTQSTSFLGPLALCQVESGFRMDFLS